jgi:hypothetical protein
MTVDAQVILIIFGGLFAVLGWFLKQEADRNEAKHKAHFAHEANGSMHETDRDRVAIKDQMRLDADALLRHQEQDDKRFDRFELKLDVLSTDIKNILKAVNK